MLGRKNTAANSVEKAVKVARSSVLGIKVFKRQLHS